MTKSLSSSRSVASVALLLSLAMTPVYEAGAVESPILVFKSTQSLIDTKKNPGCGVKLTSPQEKMDRNVRIAQLYFQSYADAPRDGLKYSLKSHKCFAEKSKIYFGNVMPPPAEPVEFKSDPSGKDLGVMELKAYQSQFPDVGTVPGTLKVVPWENGAHYSFNYIATHKGTGERFVWWEAGTLLIDDEGKITYYELWNDPSGANGISKHLFGKTYEQMPLPVYAKEIERKVKELEAQQAK